MDHKYNLEVKTAFAAAIRNAIKVVGIERFKNTSMFGSSDKTEIEFKRAA